jgi:hypothetical protein
MQHETGRKQVENQTSGARMPASDDGGLDYWSSGTTWSSSPVQFVVTVLLVTAMLALWTVATVAVA